MCCVVDEHTHLSTLQSCHMCYIDVTYTVLSGNSRLPHSRYLSPLRQTIQCDVLCIPGWYTIIFKPVSGNSRLLLLLSRVDSWRYMLSDASVVLSMTGNNGTIQCCLFVVHGPVRLHLAPTMSLLW